MVDPDEEIIEKMAVAMCKADGVRWFDAFTLPGPGKIRVAYGDTYKKAARRQLAAHRAMAEAMIKAEDQ